MSGVSSITRLINTVVCRVQPFHLTIFFVFKITTYWLCLFEPIGAKKKKKKGIFTPACRARRR